MNKKISRFLFFLAGLILTIGIDQWTKQLAVLHLKDQHPFIIWEGVFQLYYSENRGAAFGMMQGKQGLFLIIALVVVAAAFWFLVKMPLGKRYLPLTGCLFLLVSGAVGNTIDRFTNGFVVDFLYFELIDFPIFNVADCYVVIATITMCLLFFFYYREDELEFLSVGKSTKKGESN